MGSTSFALDTEKVWWSAGVILLVVLSTIMGTRPRQSGFAAASDETRMLHGLSSLFYLASWAFLVYLVGYNASGDEVTTDQQPKAIVTPIAAGLVLASMYYLATHKKKDKTLWLPALFVAIGFLAVGAMVGFEDAPGRQDQVNGWRMALGCTGAVFILASIYVVNKLAHSRWLPDSSHLPLLVLGYVMLLMGNAYVTDETQLPGYKALPCPTDVTQW